MVADDNAGISMAASIDLSIDAAVAAGGVLDDAGARFARLAAAELRVDEGWLPSDAALAQLGEAGLDAVLRIVASGMVDDWRGVHRVWAYQSRLYRHCAFTQIATPERRLAAAADYRVGDESPNPVEPDIVLIALRAPARPKPELARDVLLNLMAAHRVAALDVNHLAEHGPRNAQRAAAVTLAGGIYLDMADDAELAAATLTAEMFGASPEPAEELTSSRNAMASVGSTMLSLYPDDDAPDRALVRAFGRHLATGDGDVPTVHVHDLPALIDAIDASVTTYAEHASVAPDWYPLSSIGSHLRRVAVETDDSVLGARLAAPFPDRHLAMLTRQMLQVGPQSHSDAVWAVEIGADFVVGGLTGHADRCQGATRAAYLFAARSVARTARAAREHLLWTEA